MMATFVLAFAQGAASAIPTANVLVDGFGVIAWLPCSSFFHYAFRHTIQTEETHTYHRRDTMLSKAIGQEKRVADHTCMLVLVNRGFADDVVSLARKNGATGATILVGRGSIENSASKIPFFNLELQPEREMVLLITPQNISNRVAEQLIAERQSVFDGFLSVYGSPT